MFGLISAGAAVVFVAGRHAAGMLDGETNRRRTGPLVALPRARMLRRRRRALPAPTAR